MNAPEDNSGYIHPHTIQQLADSLEQRGTATIRYRMEHFSGMKIINIIKGLREVLGRKGIQFASISRQIYDDKYAALYMFEKIERQ